MQSPTHRISVIIVAGFLGSGKTTLIRDLLPQLRADQPKPFVILNDFANAAIDAHSLKGLGAEIKALAAGCVCCDDTDGLIRAIVAIPTTHPVLLFIEANGTTDPYRLIETLSLTPSLRHVIGSLVQITVINEARWGKRWLPGDRQTERAQVRTASAILTNRGENASAKQRQNVLKDLGTLNPHAPLLTMHEFLDLLVQGTIAQNLPPPEISEPIPHRHLHAAIQIDLPMMSEERLRHWLISLPREILRVKGLAQISEKEMAYFHRTDDALESPRIVKTAYQESIAPAAVLIGPGIQEAKIRETLYNPSSPGSPLFSL